MGCWGQVWGDLGRADVGPHVHTCSLHALALGKLYRPVPALPFPLNMQEWALLPDTVVRHLRWARAVGAASSGASLLGAARKPFGEVDPV